MPETPEIALIVTTYQKPWHLALVLASIEAQEGVAERMEVVVADDGSTDETPRIVAEYSRRVPFSVTFTTHAREAFQVARCRNEGVAASTADYLLFLDGDCVLPPDHVAQHLAHRRPRRAMLGYCYRLDKPLSERFDAAAIRSGEFLQWSPRRERRNLARRDRKARFYRFIRHPSKPKLAGGNLGIWRRDYQRVNGYDENFVGWGNEDDDLGLRLRGAGVALESILRWTRTYHLWHPATPSRPRRLPDGANFAYVNRPFRLTRCFNGLVKRRRDDLRIAVAGNPSRTEIVNRLLRTGSLTWCFTGRDAKESAEVELLFLPGSGQFSGRAEVNVLVLLEDSMAGPWLARKAHLVVSAVPNLTRHPVRYPLERFHHVLETITSISPATRHAA